MSAVFRFCVWAFCGVVMAVIGCVVGQYAIFISVFSFYFRQFHSLVFWTFSVLNQRAAAKLCGIKCCFSILRLGICASGDDFDGM